MEKHKQKIGMIPFFIPHMGCPQLCIFCNQPRISGQSEPIQVDHVYSTILDYTKDIGHEKYWEVAFYGGSFTALPKEVQRRFLEPAHRALQEGIIDGIRCSTRPDAIDDDTLDFLEFYGITTIELGVQSMNEEILQDSKRGHTSLDVEKASACIKKRSIRLGLQLLLGLPGETWQTVIETMVKVRCIQPHFVRIYPTLVVEHTELSERFLNGMYRPLDMELAISYSAAMKTYFESHHIDVIRTGLQATEEFDRGVGILGGPYAPAFGEMVVNYQYRQRIDEILEDYYGGWHEPIRTVEVRYARSHTSKIRGVKNSNVVYYEDRLTRKDDMLYGAHIIWCEYPKDESTLDIIKSRFKSDRVKQGFESDRAKNEFKSDRIKNRLEPHRVGSLIINGKAEYILR